MTIKKMNQHNGTVTILGWCHFCIYQAAFLDKFLAGVFHIICLEKGGDKGDDMR